MTEVKEINDNFTIKPVNPSKCKGFKNRNSFEQCNCKIKFGDFCGRHKNSKRRYDTYYKQMTSPDKDKIIKTKNFPIECIDNEYIQNSMKHYKLESLINEAIKSKRCRPTQKSLGLFIIDYVDMYNNVMAPYNRSKVKFFLRKRISFLQNKFKAYLKKKILNIVKIQSICRLALVQYRKECVNDSGLVGDSIYDIPSVYFIRLIEDKNIFGFDIRFLYKYLRSWRMSVIAFSKTEKNPYTNKQFDIEELKKKFKPRVKYLKVNKISLAFSSETQTDIKIDDRINKLFMDIHHMDVLKPVKAKWFFDLSLHDLRKLYRESQDWWHHRLNLTSYQKRRFINLLTTGDLFTTSNSHVSSMPKEMVQNRIISNYERLISEGQTSDDCKMGAYNVISMLVTISTTSHYGIDSAAGAHPHLIQDF